MNADAEHDEPRAGGRRRLLDRVRSATYVGDERRPREQPRESPVPRRVEVVARAEQQPVLRAMPHRAVHGIDESEEQREMDRVEEHRPRTRSEPRTKSDNRSGRDALGQELCSAMKASSAAATLSCPLGVRCTVVAKNGFSATRAKAREQIEHRDLQRGERRTEALRRAVDPQPSAHRLDDGAETVEFRGIELEARGHEHDGRSRASSVGLGRERVEYTAGHVEPLRDERRRIFEIRRHGALGRRRPAETLGELADALPRPPARRCCGARPGEGFARFPRGLPPLAIEEGRAATPRRRPRRRRWRRRLSPATRSGSSAAATCRKKSSSSTGPYPCTPALITVYVTPGAARALSRRSRTLQNVLASSTWTASTIESPSTTIRRSPGAFAPTAHPSRPGR